MDDKQIIRTLAEQVMWWHERGFAFDGGMGWFDSNEYLVHRIDCWNPLESIADAFEMQAKLDAADMFSRYMRVLVMVLFPEQGPIPGDEEVWSALLQATARQRCLAAIAMLEVKS